MITIAQVVKQGINDVADLQAALQLAMQLEFATLPPYLCAEWSIGTTDPSGVTKTINRIAEEEMFHFALCGNMLAAIGGTISIANAQFLPSYPTNELPGGIPQKLPVDLKPLSQDQLAVFMQIELPEFPPVALALAERPATIGAFYDTISAGFQAVKPPIVAGAGQVTSGTDVGAVNSIADALAAISVIKQQGEGTEGSPADPSPTATTFAHYYAFKEIAVGRKLDHSTGKWQFTGAPVTFPSVLNFQPGPSGSSAQFNQALAKLLVQLQACWTSGQSPSIGLMGSLKSQGKQLIAQGIRPEFAWSQPA